MKTLKEEIDAYLPEAKKYYEKVEKHYKSLDLNNAIEQAAQAKVPADCSGKRTSFADHQHRVGKDNCNKAAEELLSNDRLEKLRKAQSFEDIFKVTEEVRKSPNTYRLGDLWSYDTAQRIGFKFGKNCYPKEVYLQTGTYKGALLLAKNSKYQKFTTIQLRGKRHIEANTLPEEFKGIAPFLIENLLCVGHRKGWYEENR